MTYRRYAAVAPRLKRPSAYLNWLRANLEMRRRVSRIRAKPLKLTIDSTNVCQLRCPLCPTGLGIARRKGTHANPELFLHLLDEVGDYVFVLDLFNWAEPLLNVHLEELLSAASRKGISTRVSSNLSLPLSDDRIRRLVESGLSELRVSLDGASQETYGTYRRSGQFDLVFHNLRRILETKRELRSRTPWVIWQYIVFRFNEHEMQKAERMAREIGVDQLMFAPPALDSERYPLGQADLEALATWQPTHAGLDRYDEARRSRERRFLRRRRCDWHYLSSAINSDGTLMPCCTLWKPADDFGALRVGGPNGSYMEILNNERFRAVRDHLAGRAPEATGFVCDRCPTPSIMGLAEEVNRQIVLMTLVRLIEAARHWFGRLTRTG